MKKILWLILLPLVATAFAALQATAGAAQAVVPNGPQKFVLGNGLAVIIQENHESPVVSFQVLVKAGSAHERPHEYGITHLIEHMIFKGTPSTPVGQMAKRIEGLGGKVNAYTTLDHTKYYVTAASKDAGRVLDLLADAVVNASFAQDELKKEKEVVFEEIRMGQDSPARRRSKEVMKQAFGRDHPYGRPVIGSLESVGAITRQHILDFKARWYRAPNMLVVAVGDFKAAQVLGRIKKAFAALPTNPAPRFSLPSVKTPGGPRLKIMRENVKQAAIVISWPVPGLPDLRVYPLDMAATVLGEGETSRLYSGLKEERGLVDEVSATAYTPEGRGLFKVEASLAPSKVMGAWQAILKTSLAIAAAPPTPAELKRARINLNASFVRRRQTMNGQASTLGYFELIRGGYAQVSEYMARFSAVSAAQVAQAARRFFTPRNLSVVIQIPRDAPAPTQAELALAARTIYTQAAQAARQEAKSFRKTLANGMALIVKPSHAVPTVAITLTARGGQAAQSQGREGLFQLWSRSLTRGTKKRTYEQLVTEMEDMAAGLSASSGRNSCGLSGSFMAGDWRRGLALMAEVWQTPTFPQEQLGKAKLEMLARLRAQENSPTSRAFEAFRKLFYGSHPFAVDPLGTPESLQRLGRNELLAAHAKVKGPQGLVLCIVGDVDPGQVQAAVDKLWGKERGSVSVRSAPELKPPDQPRLRDISDPKAKQTQIVLAFVAPGAKDPRRHALNLLEAMLGGQGGRLFSDLRDKRSLAYAVQPFYSAGIHGGVFGFYMAVGPGKEKAALRGLGGHIARAAATPPDPGELTRAKNYVLGSLAIGLQSYGAQAGTMAGDELIGRGYQYYKRLPSEIAAVTPQDVQRVAREVLKRNREVLLTLGPAGTRKGKGGGVLK